MPVTVSPGDISQSGLQSNAIFLEIIKRWSPVGRRHGFAMMVGTFEAR
jgi:hypothetical protein